MSSSDLNLGEKKLEEIPADKESAATFGLDGGFDGFSADRIVQEPQITNKWKRGLKK